MECRVDPIPSGSHRFRIWTEDRKWGDPIDLTGILAHVDAETADVQSAHGTLPQEAQVLLGLKAWNMGYKFLTFEVPEGTKVTRFADFVKNEGGFDFYRVDLGPRIAEVMSRGAL